MQWEVDSSKQRLRVLLLGMLQALDRQLIGRTRHMGLASPEFQNWPLMAACSEYDLVLYENSSLKRVSENILSEK